MQERVITGVTGDQLIGPAILQKVRVGGAAALAGAVQIKRGAAVIETLAAATAVGVEREFAGAKFENASPLQINMANAADTIIVIHS
jgi:hypothetical protein